MLQKTPRRRLPGALRKAQSDSVSRAPFSQPATDDNLHDRLRIEHALAEASSLLVSGDQADINEVLGILGRAVNANRTYIFLFKDDYRFMENTHEWCAPGISPEIHHRHNCSTESGIWWMRHLRANETIIVPDVAAMPSEAAAEQHELQKQGIKSLLAVPMYSYGHTIGYLSFDDVSQPRNWSKEEVYLLKAASDLITSYFERSRTLDALENSEARYRELTDLLPQAVFEMDTSGLLTFVNQYALDLFGYSKEDFEKGVNVLQTIIPEHRELGTQNIRRLLNNEGYNKGNEYTALTKDGATFPVVIYSNPITRDGEVVGIRGVIVDITVQKRVEEELRSRTEELEAIISAFPDIYFWLDSTGIILGYHASVESELYVTPNHFIGRRFRDVLPMDVACKLEEAIAEASRLKSLVSVEYMLPMRGDENHYEARFMPLLDNQILAVVRNITSRKLAEKALVESEARIKKLFESTLDCLVVVDDNGCVVDVNPSACELAGLDKSEILGRSIAEFIDPDVDPDSLWFSLVNEGKQQNTINLIRSDGEVRIIEYQAIAYPLPGCHFASFRDITDRIHEQEQLNNARRMETVGQLAAGIAHDFNNLLQATLGYTRIVLENSSLDDSARQDLLEIERVSLRAADLVRQILVFSRQTPGDIKPLDITAVVDEAVQLIKTTFPKDIDVVTVIPARLSPVLADSLQIYEVLINLCVNARDAMPDGGKLIISLEQVTVTRKFVSAYPWARAGRFLRFMVSDTGQGMSEDTRKRAYEPFFTTKPLHKGTGLGLSICYGIVENHNGFMNIDSILGLGTSVSVFLPVAETPMSVETPASPAFDARGAETILVVDDEEYIRRLTDRLLSNVGYNVIQAEDGGRAVEVVRSEGADVDLVMLDLCMPGLNGVAALEAMREIKPDLKVLVLSGMDADLETLPDGVQPSKVLQKPCQPEVLLKAVREVLDR